MRLCAELMDKITALIQKNGCTQLEAARHCSVTQPRINELLRAAFRASRSMRWSTSPHTSASGCMLSYKWLEGHQKGCFSLFSGIF